MPTLADVFRLYGPAYLEKYRDKMSVRSVPSHASHLALPHTRTRHDRLSLQVLRAIARRASPLRKSALPELLRQQSSRVERKALTQLLPAPTSWSLFTVPEALLAFIDRIEGMLSSPLAFQSRCLGQDSQGSEVRRLLASASQDRLGMAQDDGHDHAQSSIHIDGHGQTDRRAESDVML